MALVGHRSRRVLVGGLGVLRDPRACAVRARPRLARHARRGVVPRRAAQLRRAHGRPGRGRGLGRGRRVLADARARRADVRRAAGAGRPRPRRPAAARRRPRRPGRRLPPEHPGDARRIPRDRQPRGDLGDVPAGVRRPQRPRTGSASSSRRCCSPWRATATATSTSIGASTWRRSATGCRASRPSSTSRSGAARTTPSRTPSPGTSSSPSAAELAFDPLPFAHPLYVLFSSGTTGLPKAILHCHGGILLEHLKNHGFSWDLQRRRPAPVVHDDRLDDVERARLRCCSSGPRS